MLAGFTQYVQVKIRDKVGAKTYPGAQPSMVGIFVLTTEVRAERQLVQTQLVLPDKGEDISVLAQVVRSIPVEQSDAMQPPGMELRFFAMSEPDRARWQRLLDSIGQGRGSGHATAVSRAAVQSGGAAPVRGIAPLGQGAAGPSSPANRRPASPPTMPPGVTTAHMPRPSAVQERVAIGAGADEKIDIRWVDRATIPPDEADAAKRAYPRRRADFVVRLRDVQAQSQAETGDVSLGGMFLRTPDVQPPGHRMSVDIVHPWTGEKYALDCTVRTIRKDAAGVPEGMGVQFDPLDERRREQFTLFVHGGLAYDVVAGESAMETAMRMAADAAAALAQNPIQKELHYRLALLYLFLMDTRRAREHLEMARALGYLITRDVWARLQEEEQLAKARG